MPQTAINHIRFFLHLINAKIQAQKLPLIVALNVTNRCNLSCTYCFGDYHHRRANDFSLAEIKELVGELHRSGTKIIYLSGGEPLLRKDIGDIIQIIKSKKMLCFLNSNGILVPQKLPELRKLDTLTISLDGRDTVNDKNRGLGTYSKIIRGIKAAKAAGIPVATNTVVNDDTIDNRNIDHVLMLAQNLGCTAEFNLPYAQTRDDEANSITNIDDEQIRKHLYYIIERQKAGAPITLSSNVRKYALAWPFSYRKAVMGKDDIPPDFTPMPCHMGRFMCMVDADGLVYPCGQLIGDFEALNIRDVGFQHAWDRLLMQRTCFTCYNLCFNEFNFLFNLKPEVVYSSALRSIRKMLPYK